ANRQVGFKNVEIAGGNQKGDGSTVESREGGGILNHGDLSLTRVFLDYNQVTGDNQGGGVGGGLYNDGGTVDADHSFIDSNIANGIGVMGERDEGGGIFNDRGVVHLLDHSIVSNNRAEGGQAHGGHVAGGTAYGGGVFNNNGDMFMDGGAVLY